MEKLPNLESLAEFTHLEVLYDSLVRQSIKEGFMTEHEFLIGRYVYKYCDLNSPEDIGEDFEKYEKIWKSHLPEAYLAAAKQFDIIPQKAEEFFQKSLDIRARNIKS